MVLKFKPARRLAAALTTVAAGLWFLLSPIAPARGGEKPAHLGKVQVADILDGHLGQLTHHKTSLVKSKSLGPLKVETTLHPVLQRRAESLIRGSKSRRVAIVVLDASSGKVLVLAGVKRRRLSPRVALEASAPAASLFKVVTAAAALERTNLEPESKLNFAGRPHTLYRYQVRKKTKRRGRNISLEKSFAKSNNPIFARLGIHRLGGEILSDYAKAMGFDRQLYFEIPVGVSHLPQPENNFGVGELACGFNRKTTISPLHAALMVALFTNGGRFMEPYMINKITSQDGEVLYRGGPRSRGRLMSRATCDDMRKMFQATVSVGTARRAFRRLGRDKVLRPLEVGGKTGTLRGPDRKELFEWFAGYARQPRSGRTLAIATMVVHGKRRYSNPKVLARRMLREAFKTCKGGNQNLCWGDGSGRGEQVTAKPMDNIQAAFKAKGKPTL